MQQPSLTSELTSGPELKCKSGLVAVEVAKVTGSRFLRRLLSCWDESPHNSSWVSNLILTFKQNRVHYEL